MSKEAIEISKLCDFIQVSLGITCDKCSFVLVLNDTDEITGLVKYYDDGWRVVKDKCLCPKCVKDKKV